MNNSEANQDLGSNSQRIQRVTIWHVVCTYSEKNLSSLESCPVTGFLRPCIHTFCIQKKDLSITYVLIHMMKWSALEPGMGQFWEEFCEVDDIGPVEGIKVYVVNWEQSFPFYSWQLHFLYAW